MNLILNVHPPEASQHAQPQHQRGDERHQPDGAEVMQFLIRPTFQPCKAVVRDVSQSGVAFLFGEPLEKSSQLALQFGSSAEEVSRVRKAEVVHCRRYTPSEDRDRWEGGSFFQRITRFLGLSSTDQLLQKEYWLIGCQFHEPLSEQDLAMVLKRP